MALWQLGKKTERGSDDRPALLGETFDTWLKIWAAAKKRRITVTELLKKFEEQNPTSYFEWKEHFGILADMAEEDEGIANPPMGGWATEWPFQAPRRSFFPPNYIPERFHTARDPKSGLTYPTVGDVRRYLLGAGEAQVAMFGETPANLCE